MINWLNLNEFRWHKPADRLAIVEIDLEVDHLEMGVSPLAPTHHYVRRIIPRKGTPLRIRRLIDEWQSNLSFRIGPTARRLEESKSRGSSDENLTKKFLFLLPRKEAIFYFKPFEIKHAIFMEYALTPKTPEGVKAFVERYGFPAKGFEPIQIRDLYIGIDIMKEAVDAWKTGERTGDYEDMLVCFNSTHHEESSRLKLQQIGDRVRPSIVAEPEGLFGAMMTQLAQAVAGDLKIKKCEWDPCPSWLTYGPGTGRRKSGRYCSDRCRKAAHRAGSVNISPASTDDQH